MKILWREGSVVLDPSLGFIDRLASRFWWLLHSESRRKSRGKPPWTIKLMTRRNLVVWLILLCWGIYYVTFQFHSYQVAYEGKGPLFTTAPNIWLQDHRHIVLDYFLTFSWVGIFITVGSLYFFLAVTTQRDFWRYGLTFWATWITQYTLQRIVNLASPMRVEDTELVFIRNEVFPWSENIVGLKNGAFPSGHIGVTLLVFLIARDLNVKWVQKVSLVCLVIMFWAILYLGEHYVIDAVASAILYPTIYFVMTRYVLKGAGVDGPDGARVTTCCRSGR